MIHYINQIDSLLSPIAWYRKRYKNQFVLTGGYFNPFHIGHLQLLQNSKELGDTLIVAVNTDECSYNKSGFSFMPLLDRMKIIDALECVCYVIENPYQDMSRLISEIKPDVYTKGGDVCEATLVRAEKDACEAVSCRIEYGVGGSKVESSSRLLANYKNHILGTYGSGT